MEGARILMVSFHFYPSPEVGAKRPSETALHLMRLGNDVTVLRAWEKRFVDRGGLDGLDLVSVHVPPRIWTAMWIRAKKMLRRRSAKDRQGLANENRETQTADPQVGPRLGLAGWLRRQLLAFDTLFQGNKRWLLYSLVSILWATRGRRVDLVIASGPPMVDYICGWCVSRLKRTKLILDFRDPWYLHGDPELRTVMLGHPLARFENSLGRLCAAQCEAVIAASPGTRRHLIERLDVPGDKVTVIRNGFDESARNDSPLPTGRLEFLYAGSLYWNRNPFPFLEALRDVVGSGRVDRRRIRLRFIGDCEEWNGRSLRAWIETHDLGDVVQALPFVSPAELRTIVDQCNVLVNFAQGQQRQIPAKSFEYIASRRDVLVITELDSDVADLFREAGTGQIVEPWDTAGFEAAILASYRKFAESHDEDRAAVDIEAYSRKVQVHEFARVVERVLAPGAEGQSGNRLT